MSIKHLCYVRCDRCKESTTCDQDGFGSTGNQARLIAKERGFIHHNGADFCPKCWDEIQRKPALIEHPVVAHEDYDIGF